MCNLYSITKGQQAIRDLAGAMRDLAGNLPMLPGVFPDYSAPIVRTAADGVRELAMARWGMPSPLSALKGRNSDSGVTNVRNSASSHWRRWLGVESRCVVPFTSFPRTRFCRTAPGRRFGSRSTTADRLRFSPASGRAGRQFARLRRARRPTISLRS